MSGQNFKTETTEVQKENLKSSNESMGLVLCSALLAQSVRDQT